MVGQVRADEEADIETMKAEIAAEEARIAELQDKIAKTTRSKLDLQVTSTLLSCTDPHAGLLSVLGS